MNFPKDTAEIEKDFKFSMIRQQSNEYFYTCKEEAERQNNESNTKTN